MLHHGLSLRVCADEGSKLYPHVIGWAVQLEIFNTYMLT